MKEPALEAKDVEEKSNDIKVEQKAPAKQKEINQEVLPEIPNK